MVVAEFHRIAFVEALEALGVNRSVVDEDVFAFGLFDESDSLAVVEPLHGSF